MKFEDLIKKMKPKHMIMQSVKNHLNLTDHPIIKSAVRTINSNVMIIFILAVCASIYFFDLGKLPFVTDETTYTAQTAIFAGHNEYRANFIPYSRSATNFQIYQMIASPFIGLFEINEFNARVPTAIIGLVTVFLIYILAKELFNRNIAIISALLTGLNGYSLFFNRQVNLDVTSVFFMVLSILFLVKWSNTKKNWFFYLFLISFILMAMSKVVLFFPLAAILIVFLYIKKDFMKAIRKLFKPISMIIILAAIIYIIYYITSIIGFDEFIKTLSYASGRSSRNISNYYIRVLLIFLGYIFLIATIIGLVKSLKYRKDGDILCLLWFTFIMIFFTYYPLEAYNYLLPIIPSMCILSGRAIDSFINYDYEENVSIKKRKRFAFAILPIIIVACIYPTFGLLDNPDRIVGSIAPTRFDTIKSTALKDASLWLKDNTYQNSTVAIYTFADAHVLGYYSERRAYTINNFPGFYTPTDNFTKINWKKVDVIKLIEERKINYVVYMEEPRLSKNLTNLYKDGLDFKLVYKKNYLVPDWYYRGNLNLSIFEVQKERKNIIDNINIKTLNKSFFTIVAIPDTDIYIRDRPDIFNAQINMIKDNIDTLNIKFVINTGSMVYSGISEKQWKTMNNTLEVLDGKVPYLIVPGDRDHNGHVALKNKLNFNKYFNYTKFTKYSWYGGHYPEKGNENNFGFFSAENMDFLILGLTYCPIDDDLQWANNIINTYPDKKVILFTHSYLNGEGKRISFGKKGSCSNSGIQGNEGEDIWNKLISKHQNIILVLSGHIPGISQTVDYVNNYAINQVLQNFQTLPNGGDGYLRFYMFFPDENIIVVKTYSPYLNEYETSPENYFNLEYQNQP